MRNFKTVLKFELLGLMKNKTFLISTALICLLLLVGLSFPTIRDTFFSPSSDEEIVDEAPGLGDEEQKIYGYINRNGVIANTEDLEANFYAGKLKEFENQDDLERKISSGEVRAGYVIEGPTKYEHIVLNNEMFSSDQYFFEDALITAYRISGFEQQGIEYESVHGLISVYVESDTKILGTDSAGNYAYTYILVFGLYFIIMIYGQMVATSIASEKSNRAMEVLITSTSSNTLIFGKAIAGALAGIIQFGIIIATGKLTYTVNATAWGNSLDHIFKIPTDVILTFSAFGILGYLFFVFIYAALGALVSRTEDINTSATPITIIFIGAFFVSMMGMQMPDSMLIKIASYVPLSSFMAMFVRVSMGTVSTFEVVASLTLLALTTVLIGMLAAKIYRMGTLMYGNPIKLTKAIKMIMGK